MCNTSQRRAVTEQVCNCFYPTIPGRSRGSALNSSTSGDICKQSVSLYISYPLQHAIYLFGIYGDSGCLLLWLCNGSLEESAGDWIRWLCEVPSSLMSL